MLTETFQYTYYTFNINGNEIFNHAIITNNGTRKVRELIQELLDAGFYEFSGGGKGAHRKYAHIRYAGAVTISGKSGDDAKPYQEKQVKQAIEVTKQ
ncbi:MAG: type II toxin-antitoxin system HicA family toxin [Nitrospirae bacterium]|nr:type II toxin-antitoxin system HicA family toxin [Nitrospirota bacterium]